ncbi:hybrid sensor histidine kinase/response regulator transcription factor [Flavobacterium sp. ARAG 55.4]|uniref:hybrid sensor histidine kinase/response regulator transcription factor n=1 Tax=Flavobacterium sp. ARAG 55.4 TaxID=3451357 RepID=UPI003F454D98
MKLKLFIVFILFTCLPVLGQNIKFEHYNENNGLSYNSVRHIVQDEHGFMWLGTFFGLNRFDGYQFKTYMSSEFGKNKIYNDDITALELDKDANNLWIGTRKGLTLYQMDKNVFRTFFNEKNNFNSLPEDEIRSVLVDKFKKVWVGTMNQGLAIYYPNTQRFSRVNLKGFNYIKEIFEDKKGNIWVGSFGTGSVAKIILGAKGEIIKTTAYTLSIPNSNQKNPYINFIYEDDKSDIFVGTREGLYKLNKSKNTFENLYINDAILRNKLGPYFIAIAQAPDGKYWLGTLGGLLVCNQLEDVATGKFQRYFSKLTDENSLVGNIVNSLYFDKSGVLWVGTEDGLDKYNPYGNQFKINKDISLYNDNQKPNLRGFAKTYDGNVIAATRYNGLFISRDKSFAPLHNSKNDIASVYSADGKIVYCGLWNGKVLVYNYVSNSSKIIDVGIKNSPIISFLVVDENSLVVGSFGEGAVILDSETLEIKVPKGVLLPDFQINKIKEDRFGHLWFATETGVVKYNLKTKAVKVYLKGDDEKIGLPANHVSDILIDTNGDIWVATVKGIGIYDAEKDNFIPILEPRELYGKWITDLEMDNDGYLWLNINNNSVARYKRKSKKINIYYVDSGNRLDVFSSKGFYSLNHSTIYLGGKNGIIYFSTDNIKENKISPPPVITEFKVQNEEVFPGVEINGQIPFSKDINTDKKIELNYNNRNFSVQFSAPSYTNERLNKFQYILEGFDKEWITTSSDARTIQYTNLNPAEYVFKIRAQNSDGIWSKTTAYNITILPPFWTNTKIFLLVIMILSVSSYYIRKEIKSRIKLRQALLLERVKRDSDERLSNEKLEFFTNISHELRTPLTLILGPSKQLLEQKEASDYDKTKLYLIYQNAARLLLLVNQILDFRKAQSGELKLKVSKTEIVANTQTVFDSFTQLAQEKDINFHFNCENESLEGWIDIDKYHKILYNLLSNALKFTNNYGNVDLYIGTKEENGITQLIIEVSDDGVGIPVESQEKIFSRFYQVKTSKKNNTGSGIGLSLVISLIEVHRGQLRLKSAPAKGSVFTVELPIDKSSYKKSEVFDIEYKEPEITYTAIDKTKKTNQSAELRQPILIIEDNAELRYFISDYLSEFYKVYQAENGDEGLNLCRKIKPALCVVDAMMPVMGGFQFVEALKSDENISHTALIMLTALSENEDKMKGYSLGVDGYMVKPFDPSLLKTRIDNIIKTRSELKQKFSGEIETDVSTLTHSQLDIDLISKITGLIEQNISDTELTTNFLCSELGMSSSKLYRKIKQLTDLSPNEFIRTVRLKKAAQLLKLKTHNVSEVADQVGFNDPLYFSRCFKKQFGYSPSRLIK